MISAEVRSAITDLITEFGWRVDNGYGDRVSELFVDAATLATPHFSLAGKEEIHDWFDQRASSGARLSRHISTNFRIEQVADHRYRVSAYAMTLVGTPPAPHPGADMAAGTSIDEIAIIDGRPLFVSRKLEVAFEGNIQPKGQKA